MEMTKKAAAMGTSVYEYLYLFPPQLQDLNRIKNKTHFQQNIISSRTITLGTISTCVNDKRDFWTLAGPPSCYRYKPAQSRHKQ